MLKHNNFNRQPLWPFRVILSFCFRSLFRSQDIQIILFPLSPNSHYDCEKRWWGYNLKVWEVIKCLKQKLKHILSNIPICTLSFITKLGRVADFFYLDILNCLGRLGTIFRSHFASHKTPTKIEQNKYILFNTTFWSNIVIFQKFKFAK